MSTTVMEQYTQPQEEATDYVRIGKRFGCDIDGCDKNFARRDHLDRHKLNHNQRRLKCSRCESEFARKDLLSM